MNLADMQALIVERLDPNGVLDTITGTDHGLIIWHRGDEHIVHRWATTLTDGSPVTNGVMFYSGGYHRSPEDAAADFQGRYRD